MVASRTSFAHRPSGRWMIVSAVTCANRAVDAAITGAYHIFLLAKVSSGEMQDANTAKFV